MKTPSALPMVALAALLGGSCAKKAAPAGAPVVAGSAPVALPAAHDAAPAPDVHPPLAASFDCKKARTGTEKLICASPELSDLDGQVAIAFKQALPGYMDPQLLRTAQHDWLQNTRDKATHEAQLKEAYTARLKELHEQESREIVHGDLAWRMMTSRENSDVVLPRITRWRNAKVKAAINEVLDKLSSDMGCHTEPEDEEKQPSEFSMTAEVSYAEHDIFSIEIHSGGWCAGAAHPDNDDNWSKTFDLRTGIEVGFEELFANYENKRNAILIAVFGKGITHKQSEDDELTLENLVEHSIDYAFHDDGLHVQPSFPHVIAASAEEVTAPYVDLERFANRKGLLGRIK